MVTHPGAGGVRPFLQLVEVHALRGAADRDLLRRFAAARDEAAFRVIAERHGPMVLGVCARLLGNRHDAEDALQATFLVLARRADTVRTSESLAGWLHGVAWRVAARLRRADRRRLARERAAPPPAPAAPADALAWAEVRAGLDDELGRLPAAYREVLVLCYLEGLTRDEAGRRLGLDPGAVKGRLERGRRLLGERLTRRGIGLSAALAGLAVTPPALAAVRVARLATDPAAASPRAAALTHDFLKGVTMSKLTFVTVWLAGALVIAVGVGMGTAQTPAEKAPPKDKPGTVAPAGSGKLVVPDKDTDEAFIRRVSKDLRGTDPTPAEVHFFLASKDANRRATLVDLFVKERTDAERAAAAARADAERAAAEQAAAAARRARDEADRTAEDARLRADAERARADEAKHREAAERRGKGFREPADPAAKPAPVPPPAAPTPPKTVTPPSAVPMPPAADLFTPRPTPPPVAVPLPPAAPAPAANVELLRIRVQLAEVTLREKTLAVRQVEEQVKTGAVSARELDRAKLEVERAQLLLREAQLNAEAAERAAVRSVPAAPARP